MHKKLIAANWKMFMTPAQSTALIQELLSHITQLPEDREVLITPPFTALQNATASLKNTPGFSTGAQNFYPEQQGAFTGEISPVMLTACGCTHALAGHSERRHILGEDNNLISKKILCGLSHDLHMILCVGETLSQRRAGHVEQLLREQLESALEKVDKKTGPAMLSIAYEPVWAIGTGEVADSQEIITAHTCIRTLLEKIFPEKGKQIRILYGGSVKPDNIDQILFLDNVNGVLVGGASLDAKKFADIVLAT